MDAIVDPGYLLEKGLARIAFDHYGMSIKEIIRNNLSGEIWSERVNYIKYIVKDFFYKGSHLPPSTLGNNICL